MFNVFTDQMEIFDCTFEIEVEGNKQIQRMQAPRVLIQKQFLELAQTAANDSRAVRITLKRDVSCYDEWNDRWVTHENYIEYKNNAWADKNDKN